MVVQKYFVFAITVFHPDIMYVSEAHSGQSQELTESVNKKFDTDQIRQSVSVVRLNHTPCTLVLPLNRETNAIIHQGRERNQTPVRDIIHYTGDFGLPYRRYHLEKTVHTQPHLGTQSLNLAEKTSVRANSS